jgi:hypothetical protein
MVGIEDERIFEFNLGNKQVISSTSKGGGEAPTKKCWKLK